MSDRSPRAFAAALARLPSLRAQLVTLAKDQRALVSQVRAMEDRLAEGAQRLQHLEDRARGLDEAVARLHQTLAESDPRMAIEIAGAVRDQVQDLLVEVTEQANAASAVLRRSADTPA